ncbi:unnamed protein product [Trichobilharzia szidati]|nr:unnamed protein product [Trichobilharzia szidati]
MPKHYHVIYCILISSVIILSWIREAHSGHSEKRLLNYLFDKTRWDAHNPMERPVSIDGKPVQVFLKCFLNQIMDMDEKNQILSTIMWLDIKWTDYHFQWNLSDYENIRQINLPQERMWKPDILLYNSASEKFDQMFPTKVTVRNNGQIQWVPPGLFHSICDIEVNWFPFDSQNCILKFGTWTYQGNKVDLKLQCDNETGEDKPCHYVNEVDLSTYLANSEWALEKGLVKRNIQTYGSDDQTYIDVTINVYMQRRALYYVFNIIIPCMIMSVMALLVFTLPPEANEKIVLGVTTLLSLTMLLQLVGDKLPQTSSGNPVLVLYFTCTMILCSLSLVCAVVLLNCHHHTGGIVYVPWWVETLINTWLASLLRIDHNSPEENVYASKEKLIPKHHRAHSNLTECNENTSYNKSIGRIKKQPTRANRKSKTLTNDSRDDSLNSSTKNTPIWSNVIDVNSEFRPAVLIHKTVAPQLNSPQHNVVVRQNHFVEPLQQQQVKLRNLSTRQLNRFFSQEEDEELAAAAGGMRSGVSSRLEYACNRSASLKYGKLYYFLYVNRLIGQMQVV